ncbi:hypothetical protein NKR23_g7659 [Pleurostoma richardsiae]|uniref:Uncharacterized protein n=1 Tax=Pleurostoma richardsiae TaxID=41990 RepID=A0AA38R832_9PEZI|nr:hypothetical protein NKR23_g7659 [Pleurostoma richardsiae]
METAPVPSTIAPEAGPEDFQRFHEYRWDLDVEFLKGVVLACGGLNALERTGSKAEIILHSRIFYFARLAGVSMPYVGYKRWLRDNRQFKPVDWNLLDLLCDKKDAQLSRRAPPAGSAGSISISRDSPEAQREKDAWFHELYDGGLFDPPAAVQEQLSAAVPSWQAAAPKGDLYVDHRGSAGVEKGKDEGGAPYPERFAQIIEAIQSGKPVEGIQEIPNNIARNPDTTPFGKMAAPKKPWERSSAEAKSAAPDYTTIDKSFPDAEPEH